MTVGRAPLVSGAVLVDGPIDAGVAGIAGELPAAVLLAVDSGPAAGSVLPLRRGSYLIGRTNADLTIPDADLSREHARIEVSDTALTLVDLGSINGTEVDGNRVRRTAVTIGSRIRSAIRPCRSCSLPRRRPGAPTLALPGPLWPSP